MTDPSTPLRAGSPKIATALREIATAARLAQALRDSECAIVVGGVSYGADGRRGMVALNAYSQVLAANRAKDARIAELEAALDATALALRRAQGEDQESEFGAEILEAAER